MKIERIDHLNITVADIDRSVEFYKRVLGMEIETMGEGRAALHFGQQKIHLDAAGGAMAMSGEKRMPAHICFITEFANDRGHRPPPRVRRSGADAGAARRGNRHDPIRLYRRSGPELDRDRHLLSRGLPMDLS